MSAVLHESEKLISSEKRHYRAVERNIKQNAVALNSALTDISTFYEGVAAEFSGEACFRKKLMDKLGAQKPEMTQIAPLLFKHSLSPEARRPW